MKKQQPPNKFSRWQHFIRLQQERINHALTLVNDRREYGQATRKEAAKWASLENADTCIIMGQKSQ